MLNTGLMCPRCGEENLPRRSPRIDLVDTEGRVEAVCSTCAYSWVPSRGSAKIGAKKSLHAPAEPCTLGQLTATTFLRNC